MYAKRLEIPSIFLLPLVFRYWKHQSRVHLSNMFSLAFLSSCTLLDSFMRSVSCRESQELTQASIYSQGSQWYRGMVLTQWIQTDLRPVLSMPLLLHCTSVQAPWATRFLTQRLALHYSSTSLQDRQTDRLRVHTWLHRLRLF